MIRDDQIGEIAQEELVVGDIVSLEEGDKIPADLRIIESFNLRTNDVSLTGESMPRRSSQIILKRKDLLQIEIIWLI